MSKSPAPALELSPTALELPAKEPAPRPDPWLSDGAYAVDAFLAGLRSTRS
jgi:hypothetical protein